MTEILTLLIKADNLLDQISVRGNDVYLMADARKMLKEAFDVASAQNSEETGDSNGG